MDLCTYHPPWLGCQTPRRTAIIERWVHVASAFVPGGGGSVRRPATTSVISRALPALTRKRTRARQTPENRHCSSCVINNKDKVHPEPRHRAATLLRVAPAGLRGSPLQSENPTSEILNFLPATAAFRLRLVRLATRCPAAVLFPAGRRPPGRGCCRRSWSTSIGRGPGRGR